MIDLMNVACEDHLGPLACSSDDGLYLKRGQVLCFINNEENLLEFPRARYRDSDYRA